MSTELVCIALIVVAGVPRGYTILLYEANSDHAYLICTFLKLYRFILFYRPEVCLSEFSCIDFREKQHKMELKGT